MLEEEAYLRTVVVLSPQQTNVAMTPDHRQSAIDAAMWITASPHEWVWSQAQQEHMARYVLWAHQRLSGIEQLTTGELSRG